MSPFPSVTSIEANSGKNVQVVVRPLLRDFPKQFHEFTRRKLFFRKLYNRLTRELGCGDFVLSGAFRLQCGRGRGNGPSYPNNWWCWLLGVASMRTALSCRTQ